MLVHMFFMLNSTKCTERTITLYDLLKEVENSRNECLANDLCNLACYNEKFDIRKCCQQRIASKRMYERKLTTIHALHKIIWTYMEKYKTTSATKDNDLAEVTVALKFLKIEISSKLMFDRWVTDTFKIKIELLSSMLTDLRSINKKNGAYINLMFPSESTISNCAILPDISCSNHEKIEHCMKIAKTSIEQKQAEKEKDAVTFCVKDKQNEHESHTIVHQYKSYYRPCDKNIEYVYFEIRICIKCPKKDIPIES